MILFYLSSGSGGMADALDSGSSGHCARAGSSPVIRSNCGKDHREIDGLFFMQAE